jgi:hypothetical protein
MMEASIVHLRWTVAGNAPRIFLLPSPPVLRGRRAGDEGADCTNNDLLLEAKQFA